MQLSSASFAYPQLDGRTRARVAAALPKENLPPNTFILPTCLRVEVAVPDDATGLKQVLADLLGALPAEPVIRHDSAAAAHLFRVAAGLESPIVGEVEILTQFRRAMADMKERGDFEGPFVKLLEAAVAAGREARTRMDSTPHDTMAAIAAQVVGSSPRVAVLGSGTMARAVVSALAALPAPPYIRLLARSPEQVTVPDIEVGSIQDLEEALFRFPAVVSATAAATALLDAQQLRSAVAGRNEPLLLVDMAMPPDFVPAPGQSLHYVDIDELATMAWRRPRTNEVEELVAAAAAEAGHRYTHNDRAGQLIARLLQTGDAVVDQTVDRFAGRLSSDSDRDVLRQAAHTVARTILSRPATAVRASRDRRVIEAIAAAFNDE